MGRLGRQRGRRRNDHASRRLRHRGRRRWRHGEHRKAGTDRLPLCGCVIARCSRRFGRGCVAPHGGAARRHETDRAPPVPAGRVEPCCSFLIPTVQRLPRLRRGTKVVEHAEIDCDRGQLAVVAKGLRLCSGNKMAGHRGDRAKKRNRSHPCAAAEPSGTAAVGAWRHAMSHPRSCQAPRGKTQAYSNRITAATRHLGTEDRSASLSSRAKGWCR